ncbi:hypothetical protein FRB99_004627 [Tulasnella sp. 403]|nr:hypothetical protein FRB99_004627 [Tulasnella sp. 403]
MGFYEFFGVTIPFDPDCTLVTSNVISPFAFGLFRLVVAIYSLTAIIFIMVWDAVELHTLQTTWENLSVHALNSAIALTEILLSRIVPRWSNIPILVLILAGYLGVAYITHATQGYYTYSFLNPKKEGAKLAAYIIGIPVGAIIVLVLVKGVCWARDRLLGGIRHHPEDDEYGLQEKPNDV